MEKRNERTELVAPTTPGLPPSHGYGARVVGQGPVTYGYPLHAGYSPELPDDSDQAGLLEYWRTLRRRKGTLILIAGIGLLAGILITLPQTPVYQAKTTLEILELNQNFMGMNNVQQMNEGGTGSNLMTDIQTQIKILQSESLTDRTLAAMGVKREDLKSGGTSKMSAWSRALNLPDSKPEDQHAAALKMAADDLKAKASGQTKIIEILVDSTEPRVAEEFANRLTQEYIDQNMEARWKMTQRTGEFLSKQLDEMRIKLERSEDALQEYARKNGLLFTGDKEKTNVSEEKLSQLQAELTKAQTERVGKQSRWEMASSAPADSLPDVLNDLSLRDYQTKLTDLNRQKAEMEESYGAQHPKVRKLDAQIGTVEKSLTRQRGDILRRIKNEYDEASRRERLLEADYKRQTGVVTDQGEKGIQYGILKRELESNRGLYDSMLQKLKEASVSSALKASNVRVVDAAKLPKRPYKPMVVLNAALGLMGGVFFGVAFVIMTARADRTLQDPSDVAFYLNTPELGMIPAAESTHHRHGYGRYFQSKASRLLEGANELAERNELGVVTFKRKASVLAESFRAALTSILFTGQNGVRPRSLVVTSANPGEGKTTVACNLAISMAESGQRVLLVDADTRKPRIHEVFDLGNETGLTSLLQAVNGQNGHGAAKKRPELPVTYVRVGSGDGAGVSSSRKLLEGGLEGVAESSEAPAPAGPAESAPDADVGIVKGTMVENLFVLTSGPGVAGATNLLYSKKLGEYLARFSEEFDMVVVDTPPMLQIPDARVIGKLVSGVVLVVRAGKTTRDAAVAARARLREDGIPVVGTIMNDWNPKRSPGGYYGYYDGYHRYYKKYYGSGSGD